MYCSNCGAQRKTNAKFCHQCGTAIGGANRVSKATQPKADDTRNWLNSFGAFLFIPLFAIIVLLLFWSNREPEPINAANGNTVSQNAAPNEAMMGDIHDTLQRLKDNVNDDPKDLVSIDSLAVMYAIAGNYQTSKEYYGMHLEVEPDNKDILIAMALTEHNLKNDAKAMELLQQVLDKEPTYAFALHYMAELQDTMHKHDEAKENWQKIIDIYPGTEFAKMASKRMQEIETHE